MGFFDWFKDAIPRPTVILQPTAQASKVYSLATIDDTIRLQTRLTELGYLDPPSDGAWGGTSRWALGALCKAQGVAFDPKNLTITPEVQKVLQEAKPLPLDLTGTGIVNRICRTMQKMGMFLCRAPHALTIAYVEGMNPDGTLNDNSPNKFNDIRCLILFDAAGKPAFARSPPWYATTEPGRYWTLNPMNSGGAFHVANNMQQKAWIMGHYHTMEALVQASPLKGFRDPKKTMHRDLNHPVEGMFGVHHHGGYNLPHDDLGRSSAGCLVGQSMDGHKLFVDMCKTDPRFVANPAYKFMAAVLDGKIVATS